jgi:hypothetical protein
MNNTTEDNGTIRKFETGATRDTAGNKHDYEGFISPLVIEAYGDYMHENRRQKDGTLRDSDNWQKGIPLKVYIKSGWRHFFQWWKISRGLPCKDENGKPVDLRHAICGLLFNAMGYLHESLKVATIIEPAFPPMYSAEEILLENLRREAKAAFETELSKKLNDRPPFTEAELNAKMFTPHPIEEVNPIKKEPSYPRFFFRLTGNGTIRTVYCFASKDCGRAWYPDEKPHPYWGAMNWNVSEMFSAKIRASEITETSAYDDHNVPLPLKDWPHWKDNICGDAAAVKESVLND